MRNRWTTGLLSGLLTVAVLPVSPVSAVSGEVIGPAALELFTAYGVETVSVVKSEKF